MKKRTFKLTGILFIIAGIVLVLNSFSGITGFAILESVSKQAGSVLGLALIIGGALILVRGRIERPSRLEGKILTAAEYSERIDSLEPDPEKRAIVFDTSAILEYTPASLQTILNKYKGQTYVTRSVLTELERKDKRLHEITKRNTLIVIPPKSYKTVARAHLEETEKVKLYEYLVPILDPVLQGKKKASDLTERELKEIAKKTKRLHSLAKNDNYDMGRGMPGLKKIRDYLGQHCKLSETDVDVLAGALYKMRHDKKHAIVGEKDIDFEQSIGTIKKDNPKTEPNLDYAHPYRK